MKVQIIADELYPMYVIDQEPEEGWRPIVEVPYELVTRYEAVCKEFYKVREEVRQYYKQGEPK